VGCHDIWSENAGTTY
jgi:hypothetical protein